MTSNESATWRKSSYSDANGDCVEVASWRNSSHSDANGECVEVASRQRLVCVRDTTQHGTGPVLEFQARAWISFIAAI